MHRQRRDPGPDQGVGGAAVRDAGLGPQPPEQPDLFVEAAPPAFEVLPEALVFDAVPSNADPETQSASGEQVYLGRLLRDQRGLPLGQD